jgi:hypothetical protein
VLQAKFRRQNVGTKDLEWLRGQLRDEFAAWLNPAAARVRWGRTPEYLIVTTNVRLSSVAGSGGIDQVRALLAGQAQQLGLKGAGGQRRCALPGLLDTRDVPADDGGVRGRAPGDVHPGQWAHLPHRHSE